ncbi:universal stress protein, partial [Acidobacteria bacterium ACD]|nr:universal stress protein [Acidobacteria bacterium ACD]
MTDRSQHQTTHHQQSLPAPDALRSLLVPLDLSANADRVAGRAALLPLARSAELTLLHVMPKGLPPASARKAKALAHEALGSTARRLEQALPRSVRIQTVTTSGSPAVEIARYAEMFREAETKAIEAALRRYGVESSEVPPIVWTFIAAS